jgi:excinuclease ABC subunit B
MPDFDLVAPFQPTGDQPAAIERLTDGLARGLRHQTLLGATGTGKTYTLAQTIATHNKPTLVLAHNKTLAAQLYAEFREFFPNNAVEYFVSYFDYYQPEAYLPRSDTYIEKDSSRNDEIDRLRHAATHALFERRDVIIVASVSCIYGLGAPVDYGATVLKLRVGGQYRRDAVLRHLVDLQYQRNDQSLTRARFRVRGDTLELQPASEEYLIRIEFFGDVVERITELDPLTGELLNERREANVYPATHFVTPTTSSRKPSSTSRPRWRSGSASSRPRAARWRRPAPAATTFDLEMLPRARLLHRRRELLAPPRPARGGLPAVDAARLLPAGLAARRRRVAHDDPAGRRHVQERSDPQGDPRRLRVPLPSALDNRPLTFEEFEATVLQAIYMSATPGPYELERSQGQVAQQLIRPTGHRRPAHHGQADREPDRRPARGDPPRVERASAPWSRP